MIEHRDTARGAAPSRRLLLGCALGLALTGGTARAQEVVKINNILGKFEAEQPTAEACLPWAGDAATAHSCTCCVAHKYLTGTDPGAIENQCTAVNLCTAATLNTLDGTIAGRTERIALGTLVAKRLPHGNHIAGADATLDADIAPVELTDTDRDAVMDLLDAARGANLAFPPSGAQRDPFSTGRLKRRCVDIRAGRPGEFTFALYFIRFSDACDTAADGGAPWTTGGHTLRYVVKVLKNPMGELYNLEDLKDLLNARGYWAAQAANGLPGIIVPSFSISYMAGDVRRYMTVMPAAPGKPLSGFADDLARSDVGPGGLSPVPNNQLGRLYAAWKAVGDKLGNFHRYFMAPRDPGAAGPILRPTVIHGDFHQDNVFFDDATGSVTFIDAESMAGSLRAYLDATDTKAANVGVAPAWPDFVRPFAFSCCLDHLAFLGHNPPPLFSKRLLNRFSKPQIVDLTIRPFLKGYIERLIPTSLSADVNHADLAALKAELWAAFNRNATALSWSTWHLGVPGAKPALYSPWRYFVWKQAMRPLLTGASAGPAATTGSI